MNLRATLAALGLFVGISGLLMLPAALCAVIYRQGDLLALLESAAVSVLLGAASWFTFRRDIRRIGIRDGFAVVTMAWVLVPLFGALPYLLSGVIPSFTDAYFESVSGFTTTGASILRDVESLPRGILFWRSMTHWIGGIGIIVMALAILPLFGVGGMQLFAAEVAGPTKDRLAPRLVETARIFGKLYVGVTALEVGALIAGGMPVFDSICHSFGTIASGGFSVRNASFAAYDSAYLDAVATIFMLVAGTNFALHYAALRGRAGSYWRDDEFRFFAISYGIATIVVTAALVLGAPRAPLSGALRLASFNVASIMSCTGFANADFALWPPFAQLVLLYLLFPGGCAGSTSGAMKNVRVLLMGKMVWITVRRALHAQAVLQVLHNHVAVRRETLASVAAFVTLYFATFLLSSLTLALTGMDPISAMSASATCLAGCGPGLGVVGPMSNYADLSTIAKWILDACMLAGRLELFTVLILFTRSYWRD